MESIKTPYRVGYLSNPGENSPIAHNYDVTAAVIADYIAAKIYHKDEHFLLTFTFSPPIGDGISGQRFKVLAIEPADTVLEACYQLFSKMLTPERYNRLLSWAIKQGAK